MAVAALSVPSGVVAAPTVASSQCLSLTPGASAQIAIKGIPGTGYQWAYAPDESSNDEVVSVESLGYGPPLADRIGGNADFGFSLTALRPGPAALVFVYRRSWENVPVKWHFVCARVAPAPK